MKKRFLLSIVTLTLLVVSVGNCFALAPFKFAVIADPHTSVAGPKSPENGVKMFKSSTDLLKATIDAINAQGDIDFVIVLGDLTKDAEPWNVDRFQELMAELKVPYYVVLGNHDVSPVDTHASQRDPGVTRSTMIWTFQGHGYNGPNPHWSLDPVTGVHLVGLDSTMTGDWGGKLTQQGLDFLDRDLYANSDKLTIVVLHHQLLPYTPAEETGENEFNKFVAYNADQVRTVINKYPQVAMTLSGHRHLSTRYKIDGGKPYFTCPSTMTWPMRYVIYSVDNKGISYKTENVPCDPSTWNEAKQHSLDMPVTEWPRTSETPKTAEGDKKLEEIMLGEEYANGQIPFSNQLAAIVK